MDENDQNDPDYFYDDDVKYEDTEDDLLLSQRIVRRRIKDNPENRYLTCCTFSRQGKLTSPC